jgi:hypothetical protein
MPSPLWSNCLGYGVGNNRMTLVADSCASPSKDYIFPNVRDHRWLPVARLLPGEERAQAGGVTRVAIRWIALFGFLFYDFDPRCVKVQRL